MSAVDTAHLVFFRVSAQLKRFIEDQHEGDAGVVYCLSRKRVEEVAEALVREGESIQSKTRKIAGAKVNEMAAKATGTWDKLEEVFENRVSKALNSLGVPTKADIDALAKRVAQLMKQWVAEGGNG